MTRKAPQRIEPQSIEPMSSLSLHEKNVRELQELAQEAPAAPQRDRRKPLSRAARLHLIDMLSRQSATGLALVAGVSVYLAITAGRAFPARAAAWAAMILCALWVCRRLRSQFRSGDAITSRPFRWRASYTSCLSVLGVILASGPILLTPAGAPQPMMLQVAVLSLLAAAAAAMLHTAHFASAAAFAAPAAIFAVLAGLRSGDTGLFAAGLAAALLCVTGVFAVSRVIEAKAARQHPRTSFVRRDIGGRDQPNYGAKPQAGPAKTAI